MAKKAKKGIFFGTDGEIRQIEFTDDLDTLYRLIDTDIVEHVSYLDAAGYRFEGWADEEGYFHQKAPNLAVAMIFHRQIVGDLIVYGRSIDKLALHLKELGFEFCEGEDDPGCQ